MKLTKEEVELLKRIIDDAVSLSDEYAWSVKDHNDFETLALALQEKILQQVE